MMIEKFVYRMKHEYIGTLIDQDDKYYFIECEIGEGVTDTWQLEKELTVIEKHTITMESVMTMTGKQILEAMKKLVQTVGYDLVTSHDAHYYGGNIKDSTLLRTGKKLLALHYVKAYNKYNFYNHLL
jgi:hypothetical protein